MGTVTCRTCNGRGRKWIDFRKGGGKWVDCRPCNGTGSNPNLWSTRCRGCRSEIIYKAYTTEPQFCKVCKNEEHEKQCAQVGCSNRIRYKLAWSNIPNYCRYCENKRKQGCTASWCPGTGFMSCGEVVWSPPGKKFTHCRKCSEKKRAEDAAKWKTKRCLHCGNEIKYNADWSNIPDYCKNCSGKEVEKPCANARFGCDRTIKYKLSWSNVRDKCGRCHKEEQSGRSPRKCDGGCGGILFFGNGRDFTTCRVCNDKRRAEEREQRVRSLSGRRISSSDSSAAALASTLVYTLSQHDDVYVVEMSDSARQTWGLPPLKRGTTIDGGFDRGKLPFNFPVIDQWIAGTGEAVSVKSLDLDSKTYRSLGNLDRQVGKYIDEMAGYRGNERSQRQQIGENEVKQRTLLLIVRLDGSKDYQLSHLYSLKHGYAATKNVRVVIFVLV